MTGSARSAGERPARGRDGTRRSALAQEIARGAQIVNSRGHPSAIRGVGWSNDPHGLGSSAGLGTASGGSDSAGPNRTSSLARSMEAKRLRPSGTNHWTETENMERILPQHAPSAASITTVAD